MSGAFAARHTDKDDANKGRVDATRVKRYWPGKAPEWAQEADEAAAPAVERIRTEVAAPVIVKRADDPRLQRLQAARGHGDREEALQRHREVRAAEVVRRAEDLPGSDQQRGAEGDGAPQIKVEIKEEDDEEAIQRKRQAMRERLLQQQREQAAAAAAAAAEEEEGSEEEGSSEYETDSDEEEGPRMIKPVFVPKNARDTVAEKARLEEEEALTAEAEKARLEARAAETRALVAERIALEVAAAKAAAEGPAELGDVNTDTDEEPEQAEAEFEAWRTRELQRIRRDRQAMAAFERDQAEKDAGRNGAPSSAEGAPSSTAGGAGSVVDVAEQQRRKAKAAAGKWNFMQKYYHKGAFFQEMPDDAFGTAGAAEIYKRDYSAPTGEDKVDRSLLPAVMQVKAGKFGRSGQTKWKHLGAEDTTRGREDDWRQVDWQAGESRKRQVAQGGVFDKPKKFKR